MEEQIHPTTMRLQRYLARAGVASRRGSENLMTAGRVCVNGEVVRELGSKVNPSKDVVSVDGVVVSLNDESRYLVLNKPSGYLTTMSDPYGRPCVADLVANAMLPGLFPVGRLDMDTTGILLFTTDGDMGNVLLHPSKHVEKTYLAHVEGVPAEDAFDLLRKGIELDDGPCQPAVVELLKDNDKRIAESPFHSRTDSSICEIRIHEGRKHQVKRMFDAIGHPVFELHRTSFAGLELRNLEVGAWRYLTEEERDTLVVYKG